MFIPRADSIRDRAGTGAPDFPNGLTGNLTVQQPLLLQQPVLLLWR